MRIASSYGMTGIGIARSYIPSMPLEKVESELVHAGAKYIIYDIGCCLKAIDNIET